MKIWQNGGKQEKQPHCSLKDVQRYKFSETLTFLIQVRRVSIVSSHLKTSSLQEAIIRFLFVIRCVMNELNTPCN
jgi:hypothetical protein